MKRKGEGRNSDNSKREEILQKAGAYSAVFFMAFFVALVSASAFTPVDKTNAEDINVGVDSTGYYVNVASSSSVDLDVTAVAGGQVVIGTDQITTKSNCEGGFRVYMSVDSDTYDGLYLNGDTTEANKFSASSGTPTQPIKLATNTWGWAIPKVGESTYGFNTEYIDSNGNSSTGATGQSIMNIGDQLFAGVPKIGNEVLVQSYDAAAVSGRTQKIYYGVNATTALTSGNYTGKVIYTAVADAGKGGTTEKIGISPAEGGANGGDTVTVSTDIYSTMPDDKLLSDFSVKIDGRDCTLTGVSRTTSGSLNFQCITPAMASDDEVDVALTSAVFGRTWSLADGYTYLAATFDGIKNMQDMSSAICAAETTPTKDAKTPTKSSSTAASDPTTYVPETILTDTRDGRTYLVRKLADGNCWMSQNLELTFYEKTNGTGYNTDITARNDAGTKKGISVANGKTTLTPADTDISSNLDLSNPGFDLYATQSIDGPRWSDTGETGDGTDPATGTGGTGTNGTGEGRSFSHAAYNASQLYAYDRGTVSPYGQIQFDVSSAGEPQQRGGNLYNWTTATLGSGANLSSGEASASICPAHWQLPSNDGTHSIINLLVAYYGESARGQSGDPRTNSTAAEPSALTQMQNLMRSEPISMVVSGYYDRSNGRLMARTADGGYVWSSTADGISAHYLSTNPTRFNPQLSFYRGLGLTVRCVAR